ncbi:MAG: SLOG family protein, partial [Oscillospiraceae bacterium]|nr:SLOG family protein [Oscillospiraceae bacterium]
ACAEGFKVFISGMAMGFDIYCAEAVLALREQYGVKLHCAVPFEGQERDYTDAYKARYRRIIEDADKVVTLEKDYSPACYRKRNEFMVDSSSRLICFCRGSAGGTFNTVKYAQRQNITVINLYDELRDY